MSHDALYLYALARHGTVEGLDLAGVEDGTSAEVLTCGALDAVVSHVPRAQYERSRDELTPADPVWVIPRALRHDEVVCALASRGAALPARFGTVFSSDETLIRVINTNAHIIQTFLDDVAGKSEWSVRAWIDVEESTGRLLAEDPSFAARMARLPAGPGARYLGEKRLREEARVAARRAALAAARRAREHLAALAPTHDLPLRRPEPSGRTMVLNLACLLDPSAAAGMEQLRTETLDEGPPGLEFEINGPWPAFHFCPELALESA